MTLYALNIFEYGRVALCLLAICIAYVLGKALYRISRGRLRGFPGTAESKFTAGRIAIATLQGRRAQELLRLHQEHGDIVRIGPNEVSIGNFRYYRSIYSDANSITKDPDFYAGATFCGHDNIFQMVNPAQHQARRKLSAAPYSTHSVNLLNELIRRRADCLVTNFITRAAASPLQTVDAYEICGLYSLEVICEAAFAIDLDSKTSFVDSSALLEAMDGSAKTLIFNTILPFLRKTGLEQRVPGLIGDCYRKHAYWQSISRQMIDHLLKSTITDQNCDKYLITPLFTGIDKFLGRKLTYDEIHEEAMGIMFAGSGTTSTTLTYLLYALSRPFNKHVQEKLRGEIASLPENDITVLRLNPYVNAVIKEAFRLYPTIISTLPRVLGKPIEVGGFVLPVGTVVGMQNYVHHRDPRVFPDPECFDPERWLSSSPEMEQCLTPFSVGRRNCVGQNLAWDELYLAVEALMRSGIRLELSEEMQDWEMDMEDRFNIAPKGRRLMLKVTKP